MAQTGINGEELDYYVLSVRLSMKEFKCLKLTLKNFDIQGKNLSVKVRELLTNSHYRSWKHRTKRKKRLDHAEQAPRLSLAEERKQRWAAATEEDEELDFSPIVFDD